MTASSHTTTKRRAVRYFKDQHDALCKAEIPNYEKEGYRVVPIGIKGFPIPDLIVIKDGKIFAVEVNNGTHWSQRTTKMTLYGKSGAAKYYDGMYFHEPGRARAARERDERIRRETRLANILDGREVEIIPKGVK